MVVYKATCQKSKKFYIGNTQQHLKTRLNQHFGDVCSLANKKVTSDSFARHFAAFFEEGKATRKLVRTGVTVEILWKGNPISLMHEKLRSSLMLVFFLTRKSVLTREWLFLTNQITEIYFPRLLNFLGLVSSTNQRAIP